MPAEHGSKPFDFIVVGAGAGGGPVACNLAKRGYRVLLVEAGHRDCPDASDIPAFHAVASEAPEMSWEFFVRHYADADRGRQDTKWDTKENGVFYPRASGLGGCTLHNAMITMSGPADDWDYIAGLTGDKSWNSYRMRSYFERLENCQYAARPGVPSRYIVRRFLDRVFKALRRARPNRGRHGFDGWLHTVIANPRIIIPDKKLLVHLLGALLATRTAQLLDLSLLVRGLLLGNLGVHFDPNHWERLRDRPEGIALVPTAVNKGQRRSVRDHILETEQAYPDNLTIWTDTVVTEVIWSDRSDNGVPIAVGVRFQQGKNLYRAHATPGERSGKAGEVFCKREVILCGGAFNTPQLLMLSGIGPAEELKKHGIRVRVNLPGVGANLQDRYEIGVVWKMKEEFAILRGLKFELEGEGDPALRQWRVEKSGLYATNGVVLAILKKSTTELATPDLCIFGLPGKFKGYYKGYSKDIASSANTFTWAILKANTKNRGGAVRLRSADPLEPPEVQFAYFDDGTDIEEDDLTAMVAGIKFVRQFFRFGPKGSRELIPGEAIASDDDLRRFIQNEAWGHHASCTCPIGADGDTMAVLDSRFRVRGVHNLRVVDASAFPKIPGVFIVANVYMMSEKASDVIESDHRR